MKSPRCHKGRSSNECKVEGRFGGVFSYRIRSSISKCKKRLEEDQRRSVK